jgi:hypothetical protein
MDVTAPKVLATGEAEVTRYLEKAGVPDFGITAMLDGAQDAPGRWPWGVWLDEASDDQVAVTVTFESGVFRVESGSADEYVAHADGEDYDDED